MLLWGYPNPRILPKAYPSLWSHGNADLEHSSSLHMLANANSSKTTCLCHSLATKHNQTWLGTSAMLLGSELMGGLAELEIDSASMYDFDN